MEKFFQYVSGEWAVLTQAPASFIGLVVLSFAGAWLLARLQFSDRLASKDGQLSLRNDVIKELERKDKALSDEVAHNIELQQTKIEAIESELKDLGDTDLVAIYNEAKGENSDLKSRLQELEDNPILGDWSKLPDA